MMSVWSKRAESQQSSLCVEGRNAWEGSFLEENGLVVWKMACPWELDTEVGSGHGHRVLPDSFGVFSVWWPKEVLTLRMPCCDVDDRLDTGPGKESIMVLKLQFCR